MATLLTFRLDRATRERVRERLTREGTTLSSVVTRGLREYVSAAGSSAASSRVRELPEHVVAWLRELRSAGASEPLSAALAELHSHGWPLERLAAALGVSKQAVQARVRRAASRGAAAVGGSGSGRAAGRGDASGGADGSGAPGLVPGFVRRRPPAPEARPHLTVRIDGGLRAAAHRAAAGEGRSLSQVVETILNRYLHPGAAVGEPADGSEAGTGPAPSARRGAVRGPRHKSDI
jgi:antitoxin component of RelBE/YafQ-DinJ toxin-antitoxin module